MEMKMELRHIVQKLGVFVLLMTLFYGMTALVLNRTVAKGRRLIVYINPLAVRLGGQEQAMTHDFDPSQRYDVFVVGSSHAYRGYDPRVFQPYGIQLFNAGSSAQHPSISYLVLQRMLPQLKQKPLVIIDVFDRILEMDGGESSGRMMTNCKDPLLATDIFWAKPDVVALNTYLSRWLAKSDFTEMELKDYVTNGYCSREGVFEKELDTLPSTFTAHIRAIEGLDHCMQWLQKEGYPFVLVSHPMPNQVGRNEFHAGAIQAMKPLIDQYNVRYYDFTMYDFGTQWRNYFWDATHLNQAGVDAFNILLIETLRTEGLLEVSTP